MALVGSGLGGSVGVAAEATYGTFVVPTRWPEFESETLKWVPKVVTGKAINGGLAPSLAQRVVTSSMVQGELKTYAFQSGLGIFFEQLFGSSTIAQQGATNAWLQTHTIGDVAGKSLSLQVNRPDTAKGDHPYSYSGLKVSQMLLECGLDEIAALTLSFLGKQLSTSEALTAPAPVAGNAPFHFAQGVITAGAIGSEAEVLSVTKASTTIKRGFDDKRFPIGGAGLMAEPTQNAWMDAGGTFDTEFINSTDWETAYNTQAPLSAYLTFTGPVISGTYNYELKLWFPNIAFDDGGPEIAGPDILKPSYKWTAYDDGTHGLCTLTYQTTDTAI